MPGQLSLVTSRNAFLKRHGDVNDDGQGADAALDFFSLANGAGGLAIVRITDGNEQQAESTLYTRNKSVLTPMGKVKAKNGGRWGGRLKRATYALDSAGDLNETTLQLPAAAASSYKKDQWKGGYIELSAVAGKRYEIVSNTAAGLITVASDATMETDFASSVDLRFYLVLEDDGSNVSIEVGDGEESPDTEFSISVYVDGVFVKKYGNLSTDPDSAKYWVDVINSDDGNDEIEAVDLWTGAQTASIRPATHYGNISSLTATVLTATIYEFAINSPGGGTPTFALGTTNDSMVAQTITITMSSATVGAAVSDKFGSIGTVTLGTAFTPNNKWTPPFTVTAGGSPLAATNTLVIRYRPFIPSALVGGKLYPDKVNAKRVNYRITANDHKTITVSSGNDLTADGATNDAFMVVARLPLEGGRDGVADLVDANYIDGPWNVDVSPFNELLGRGLGVVKMATPGITATAVQKAGLAFAAAKNHQYRVEVPSNVITDDGAITYINDTIGRSDYGVVSFPSCSYVPHPNSDFARQGRLKLVTSTGQIHGREARIAADYQGYHKAEAGQDATLPRIQKLPTGDRILNEELLNPAGIGVIKKMKGNFVLWGDRTIALDTNWKFKHHRELMSYYEHVILENFDFIMFTINDSDSDSDAKTALVSMFEPEWRKRALRGTKFADACKIKLDDDLNTDASRAAGDKIAEVSLRLADVTERFIVRIGRQGVFEDVA